jgi:hypothetical protein
MVASTIMKIFDFIDKRMWMGMREHTLFNLMRMEPGTVSHWNLYDSEQRFLNSISSLTKMSQHIRCTNPKCNVAGDSLFYPMEGFAPRSPDIVEPHFNTEGR